MLIEFYNRRPLHSDNSKSKLKPGEQKKYSIFTNLDSGKTEAASASASHHFLFYKMSFFFIIFTSRQSYVRQERSQMQKVSLQVSSFSLPSCQKKGTVNWDLSCGLLCTEAKTTLTGELSLTSCCWVSGRPQFSLLLIEVVILSHPTIHKNILCCCKKQNLNPFYIISK